ncbi:hypothetical protein PRNP1_014170 [Phytophthora ramorum]
MPGEKRHVAGLLGDQEALGANWKSAQCVTSLYDSYIQLQRENEELRENGRRFQQETELLAAQSKQNKLRDPEDTRCEELEQEIRLLRSEKMRTEEAHRLELQKTEARAAHSEATYQQLVAKYQERFEFDPLEAKRAAMAVKTMQNTLQNAVLEKEELGIRLGELAEQYRKFQKDQVEIVQSLKERVRVYEQQRVRAGQQRVVNALSLWSTSQIQSAWGKWTALVREQRQREQHSKLVTSLEVKVDERVAKLQGNQAALLAMKLLQQSARRTFIRWRDLMRQNVERRRKEKRFTEERSRKRVKRVVKCWRMECQKAVSHRSGMLKIERLLTGRSRRWGMRKWSVQTFRLALAEKDRRLDVLNGTTGLQVKTIVSLEGALEDARKGIRERQEQYEEEKARYMASIETHRATELAIRQKLGRFFTKQSDRQLLKGVLREWKMTARYLQGINQRADVAKAKLRILKLRRSVCDWHCTAHQSNKKRTQTQQILARMRQIGVLKCFNSWKEKAREKSLRKIALLHAVNRIRNRGVARCFTQWAAFWQQRASLRQGIDVMAKCAMKQQAFFMFRSWRERVVQLKIEAQTRQQELIQKAWESRLAQAKWDLTFQRECFSRWHDAVLRRQRQDAVVKKCLARIKNGSLARVLGSWREFVESRKTQRELVRRWVGRCHAGVLQRAWNRWQRQIVLKEQQILMLQLQEQRDAELEKLATEFEEYRKAQQLLLQEAEQAQTQQENKLQATNARLYEEAKRAQRLTGAVEMLCMTRERGSTLVRCFKAWQKVVRQAVYARRLVHDFQTAVKAHHTRAILSKWKRFSTQQKRLKAVHRTIQSCFSRWWQTQCLEAWKEARRRRRAVQVFSTLFVRNSETYICRGIVSEWRKLARRNGSLRWTLEKIWLGSVHAKMRQQFTHWAALTRAEAAKEQVEKRNVALTAIRAKVWWKQSVSTMRCCFSEWKDTVKRRKTRRQAERKLMLFQQTRVAQLCFSAWAGFVLLQVREEERNQRFRCWIRKFLRRKQERAMALWKMLLIRNQLCALNELKKLKSAQQEELERQREEISVLKETASETQSKLANVFVVHDESTTKMQYLTECGLVAKYFNALKLKLSMTQYQRQAVHFCQKNARRRHLAELFSSWYSFSQKCHAVTLTVAQKARRCQDVLTRTALREWQLVTYQHRVTKQKQLKLRQRVRSRRLITAFVDWHRSIHRQRVVSVAVDRLEGIAQKQKRRSSLSLWHQKCLQEKARETREKEKRKKIMQFLMGRQEAGLVRTFHSWKELTQIKAAIRSHAQVRYSKKRHDSLAESWRCWRSTVKTVKLQRKSVQIIQGLTTRFYCRIALSRWTRYTFMSQIALLQTSNAALTSQVEESSHRLQSTSMSVDQLSTELMQLQDKLYEAEARSSAVSLESSAQAAKRNKRFTCLASLSKMLLKRTVSREVSEAFSVWKGKLYDLRRKHQALVRAVLIRQRRKRWLAFWLWKVKTLRLRQLESLKKLWGRNDLLSIVRKWRKHSAAQAKLRLFLTRRCLLSYSTQCLPTSIAFRLWKTKSAEMTALQQVTALHARLESEQYSSSTHLRRLALGKWCWIAYTHRLRQMRSFLSRCYASSTKRNAVRHLRVVEAMQQTNEAALTKAKEQSEARAQQETGALSAAEEQLSAGASFQALQTLIRRVFQPTTMKDLFVSVTSTFAQILHGSTAVLFLFDPSSNELWTQREETQLIQVPASLGIAGSTLSGGSTLVINDVGADPRFHPMVDQFVLSGLRQDDAASAFMMAAPTLQVGKPTVGMVSSALVSSDGAVYGILQVAFSTSNLSPIARRVLVTQTQLYSKTCCFYVEQIVFEMLRNCRDRVRARAPDKFIKLFKQNKNWRKYYAAIERKASEMERKLHSVLDEREELIQSKVELQKRHEEVKDKLQASERSTKDVSKLVLGWKKKLTKWQLVLDEKDRAIAEKANELEKVEKEFDRYRRERRSKELQTVLNAASPTRAKRPSSVSSQLDECEESTDKSQSLSDRGQLSILKADQTRLRSQLVRAEADNLLLVKAVSIARTQHGELPRTIQAEVSRVATRVCRRAPPEA